MLPQLPPGAWRLASWFSSLLSIRGAPVSSQESLLCLGKPESFSVSAEVLVANNFHLFLDWKMTETEGPGPIGLPEDTEERVSSGMIH